MKKTAAERANINARAALSTARTHTSAMKSIRTHLLDPGHPVEEGTLEALDRAAYSRGFSAGVRDANGED
jgi:hypothetical protein